MTRGLSSIAIVVPVLGRPDRAADLVEAAEVTANPHRVVFVCSKGDKDQIAACRRTTATTIIAPFPAGPGDFAKKANLALAKTTEDWLFVVGDDTCFCPGWDSVALATADKTGAGVVGTDDRGNARVMSGRHATHNLVARWYAVEYGTIDERPAIFHEGYDHNFCDDELVETAKARKSWAFARGSWVPHLHPNWRKGEWDETYAKGAERFREDQHLWLRVRSPLLRRGLLPAAHPV